VPAERAAAAVRVPRWCSLGSLLLSLAGLAVSAYLTVEHYTASTTLACPDTGVVSCQKVTTSPQSQFLGLPVALLGLLFFLAMVAITVPAMWRTPSLSVRRTRIGLTVLGVAFVIYLIYVELFVVDAICLWCTAVHVLTFALFTMVTLGTAAHTSGGD
jgi:uncharacterized membrane protein